MRGSVNFFQNDEIFFFLHDLRAVSLYKTDGCTALDLLLIGLCLSGSIMGVF